MCQSPVLGIARGSMEFWLCSCDCLQTEAGCAHDVQLPRRCATGLVYLGGGRALATAGADAQLCFWGTGDEEPHSYQVLRCLPCALYI